MNILRTNLTRTFAIILLLTSSMTVNAAIAVIAHPDVDDSGISRSVLAKIYLGKVKSYPNGVKVIPFDLPKKSSIRKAFYKTVVNKTDREINRYWSKLKYTGKGKPPKQIDSNRGVIKTVGQTEGAIGYIDARYVKFLKKSVKVVLTLP
ncbi:hypothetical protein MNBD_GAMMA22-2375 [hydrothermal vent metagenome]|uniref:Uncharacterized protein n=1 Tax=hydrothermal vent metagenome TaxID=652676 RepID=A0A3B1AE38_9ZZZZ